MQPEPQGTEDQELVAFRVAGEEYGVDIMEVREIRGWVEVTRLPHTPDHVRGAINLRGTVLPIVDLGGSFGLPLTSPTERHVIVVVQAGSRLLGLLVDAVCDILTVREDAMQPVPEAAGQKHAAIRALIAQDERMLRVIDTARLFEQTVRQAA